MAASLPWHRRLEARALAGVTVIVGASLVALTVVADDVVSDHAIGRAESELAAGQAAFTHLIGTQSQLVAAQTRIITALPVFRAHMTDSRLVSDHATMDAMAQMYREELVAAFTIVSDSRGRWLANPGVPKDPADTLRLQALVAATSRGQAQREIVGLDHRLYLLVAEPATFGDEVLGTLTAGYALDNAMASEVARTTGRDVALVTGDGVSGSSLSDAEQSQLTAVLHAEHSPLRKSGVVTRMHLGDQEYAGAAFPLASPGTRAATGRLILLESWTPTAAFIDQIRSRLLWAGGVLFAFAVALSVFLSRRMSQPLRQLAEVAGEIAEGHWDRRVSPGGSAEAAVMADAFNHMTASLSHWHAEAAQRTEQLQASYHRYFAVMQSVHDPIVSTDGSGGILFWHPRAEALFGVKEEDAIGRQFASLLAPGCQERYAAAVQVLTGRTGANAPHAMTFDGEGLRDDETPFPLELSLAAWTCGGQTCLTAVIRDVTERHKAEETLRQRDQQLREAQKMDAIGRLASGIAHDFNNSLMVIQGHAEMVMATLPDADARRKKVEVIVQATVGAAAITRRLLTFGRKQVSDARVIDPRELVSGAQKVLGRLLGDNITVVADVGTQPCYIRIDPDQLDQVIMNLAINARDAMPDGGELRFEVRQAGDDVTIAVRDTGCGMDSATAARIFEPFFTTKPADRGTGLGLSIVSSIITQSGGRIEVDTAPGRGTAFLLHLPRVERAVDTAAPAAAPVAVAHGTETVLIAEDKPLVRRILRKALEAAGYTVLEAENGEQALALARAHEGGIDLLLTDVVMPGAGGFDLSVALTAVRPDTRTIFMSGHPPGSSAREQVDSSGWPCLQKPFSFDALSRAMRSVLDGERAA